MMGKDKAEKNVYNLSTHLLNGYLSLLSSNAKSIQTFMAKSNAAAAQDSDNTQAVNRCLGLAALYNDEIAHDISERQRLDCICLE